MVHELPQELENGLLHAPHRVHTGVVPHFQILHIPDNHRDKMTPNTTAADTPGPLVTQTSRTRPFRMEAVMPNSTPFILRVRRWLRGCYFAPALLPKQVPWEEVLKPQEGMLSSYSCLKKNISHCFRNCCFPVSLETLAPACISGHTCHENALLYNFLIESRSSLSIVCMPESDLYLKPLVEFCLRCIIMRIPCTTFREQL